MLVVLANVSRVYPLEAIVKMSFASRHAMRTSVNNQRKPNQTRGGLFVFTLFDSICLILRHPFGTLTEIGSLHWLGVQTWLRINHT